MSVLLFAAFFIWFFGSSEEKENFKENSQALPLKDKPAALENFVPPTLVLFKDSESILPKRNWSTPPLELQAEAAIAVKLDGSRTYYNKNINNRRPIASITKLMTAIVVLENYQPTADHPQVGNLDEVVKISLSAIRREGAIGDLKLDELITVRSLLNIMLIDSSNDAAMALAEKRTDFVSLMNKKAKEMNLLNTKFSNPDGLDEKNNYSSALDVSKIFSYLINNHKEALEILKTQNIVVYSSDGKIKHRLKNTNELLGAVPEVKAGKTGYTDNAGESLALLISDLYANSINNDIITVVLNSPNRFGESEKLIQWLKEAYIW